MAGIEGKSQLLSARECQDELRHASVFEQPVTPHECTILGVRKNISILSKGWGVSGVWACH